MFFYSDRAGDYDVWSVKADDGTLQQVTRGDWRGYPVSSRDGSRMAMGNLNTHRLYIYDTANFEQPIDTPPPIPDPRVLNPTPVDWSPDARSLLFSSAGVNGVWLYSVVNRTYSRLTEGGGGNWLQDGRRFLYTNRGRVYLFDTGSNTTKEIFAMAGENINAARLAANDSQLFFIHSAIDSDIWLMRFAEK